MSNFTTFYDQARTAIAALSGFTTKTEIPNPYSLSDNDKHQLIDGWGIRVLDGSLSAQQEFKSVWEDASFEVVVTKEVVRTNNDITNFVTAVKSVMEDIVTLKMDFMADDQIGVSSNVEKIDFVSRSGIQSVNDNKFNYIFASILFSVTLKETL